MSTLKDLEQLAFKRRNELLPFIYHHTGGKVQKGPFKGMTFNPPLNWGDNDAIAKLLGIYEDELHEWVSKEVACEPDMVVNIGCAEGYYTVGLCRLLPKARFYVIDISDQAIHACRLNCVANNLHSLNFTARGTNPKWLNEQCGTADRPFLVVDCEGDELRLLDPVAAPNLVKASMLIECHDCIIPGITEVLINRFIDTHTIFKTTQQYKDVYSIEYLAELSDFDKAIIASEGRPEAMTWLYLVPKSEE